MIPARKLPINPSLLLRMAPLFDNSSPALFMLLCMLYSSLHFSFLCKSNLVVQTPSMTSLKVPRRLDLHVSPNGAFFQWALSIPVAIILGSPLCPVTALINHLCLKLVGPSDCLFSVRSPSTQSTQHYLSFFQIFSQGRHGIRFRHMLIRHILFTVAALRFPLHVMFLQSLSSFKAIGAAMHT